MKRHASSGMPSARAVRASTVLKELIEERRPLCKAIEPARREARGIRIHDVEADIENSCKVACRIVECVKPDVLEWICVGINSTLDHFDPERSYLADEYARELREALDAGLSEDEFDAEFAKKRGARAVLRVFDPDTVDIVLLRR